MDHGARIPANGHEVIAHELDKVGRKEPNCAPVSPQPTHPPLPVSCVQTFDQITLNKAQVSCGFSSP